jgi:glycosyltransferase involved in cell wall biosynthesis
LPARGIASAMNEGIKYSKGKYLFFLNSDDSFYNSQVLDRVHDFLVSHSDYDWAYGRIHEVNESGKTIGYPPRLPIFHSPRPNLLKYYNYIPHQATFIKKSVFDQFGGFDAQLISMMDPEYWLRISPHTKWGYMPIIVANYLIRPDSQSESEQNASYNTQEYERVQTKYLSNPQMVLAKLLNKILR